MSFAITGIYASLLILLMIALQYRVIIARATQNVSLLDGDSKGLALKMRQHGNFIENIPLAVIIMAIAEAQGTGSNWMHVIGILLVVSRIIHPFGLNFEKGATVMRIVGTSMTQIAMAICIYLILWPVIAG